MLVDAATFSHRLVTLCLKSGTIPFPAKALDRAILEKSMTMRIDPAARYSQKGIDEILMEWIQEIGRKIQVDHVTLRRALVDDGFLKRRPDGRTYRLSAPNPAPYVFAPDVDTIDVAKLIADEMKAIEARRRQHAPKKA
jgi:hypothetical protein